MALMISTRRSAGFFIQSPQWLDRSFFKACARRCAPMMAVHPALVALFDANVTRWLDGFKASALWRNGSNQRFGADNTQQRAALSI